ncbi:MAG: DUF4355 domain-containing protein [Eubacteriales bacterium]|nr:DUF4355 domain-containing protein [Eubacteriales bacterium]
METMETVMAASEENGEANLNELLMSNVALQSQYDRAISKALNTARANWEREQTQQSLARGQQTTEEQERALNEREQAIVMRERKAGAVTTLGQRGLPAELAECLDYRDEERLTASLSTMENAFQAAVSKTVSERLKGAPPKAGGGATYTNQMRAALGLK